MSDINSNEDISKAKSSHTSLWTAVVLVGLTLVLAASYKLKDQLITPVITTITVDKSCTLEEGTCMALLSNATTVRLEITPKDIPLLKPLAMKVTVEGSNATEVEVDIVQLGREQSAFNRSKLTLIKDNQYLGSSVLPICSRSKVQWEAKVLMKIGDDSIVIPFRFHTVSSM